MPVVCDTGVFARWVTPVSGVSPSIYRARHLPASTADHASSTERTATAASAPQVNPICLFLPHVTTAELCRAQH